MAAFGGLRHVQFHPDRRDRRRPGRPCRRVALAELKAHLMLFYTGIARTASDVAESYVANIEVRRRQLRAAQDLVEEGIDMLVSGADLRGVRRIAPRSVAGQAQPERQGVESEVDALYEQARAAGAVGGKLTGAGGGGFLLLFVPPEKRASVLSAAAAADSRAVRVRVGRQPDHFLRAGRRLSGSRERRGRSRSAPHRGTGRRRLNRTTEWHLWT